MSARLPAARSLAPLFRRIGPAIAAMAAIVAVITWPRAFDLEAYMAAARLSAAGADPYSATRTAGLAEWGQGQVFVSTPFVALCVKDGW